MAFPPLIGFWGGGFFSNDSQGATKGQLLKGKIVSLFFTLFHTFWHVFFIISPPGLST